ncbi:MAG: Rossmann-like domain-containing protein [Prochloraceae cyanobacterium]
MINPREIYDLLLDYATTDTKIKEITIGIVWTFCQAEEIGLCMSPGVATRTLPWSGTLTNKSIREIATWVRSWNSYQATVGMAVINAAINERSALAQKAKPLSPSSNLAVFEHFLPQIENKKVAVIGRYPGLARYAEKMELNVIELQPTAEDYPAPASEYILPEAEWVFLTGTSIVNKTFPRLVELARNAKLVLMGPTVPWLPEFKNLGIDYLAGVTVTNKLALKQTVAEGGGVRIFQTGVEYRVVEF